METEIPKDVLQFLKFFIIGAGNRTINALSKIRRIRLISADVIHLLTLGRKILSKHLQPGLAIKKF